ncbi:lysozyme, partial [Salmonella enterica subsp. enterica serovar Virchow]|nr:lysozyme [Salmonella enterica subsp. enterica serovar Virchow]ECB5955807.1 lysozyme [Salmonella enterica subsp. enterica serovar Virchow]ECB6617401.1 lysozyme [Salmonella enterica subsp. enterica serovar Virchow]ECD2620327.1 lysozyme [Salmonella enterica subsp. enterica serovar Virchow]ECD4274525.1 lysozyme [Salmonella enterica subsp. enterica serovar Virchow]
MQISSNGITRLKREEGESLKAYPDSRGIPTIGVGHTG